VLHAFEPAALDAYATTATLPYRMETIAATGIALEVPRAVEQPPWSAPIIGRAVARLERLGIPFLQTFLARRSIRDADVVVAMFESQANALAVLRRLGIRSVRRPRFVVITCWLANELVNASPTRRRFYRWAYRSVDTLVVLSVNQRSVLAAELRAAETKVRAVAFGVDTEYFHPGHNREEEHLVVAVGRDSGRDWQTLLDAAREAKFDLVIATRPRLLDGLEVPPNVTIVGYLDRAAYRDLLARASVVAVVTKELVYPTGQSVLLEAMAMGKCCVVTGTTALAEYVNDEVDALVVPPADAVATRNALERAEADPDLRSRIGVAAAAQVQTHFSAIQMWKAIGDLAREDLR
jgi:glycosyltransferase involved in cell wall biosynthesis